MGQQLFRQAALDRLSSPERLDELMVVSPPRSWIALLGLWTVILGGVAWGIYGTVPSVLNGQGILIREGGEQAVDAPTEGEPHELLAILYLRPADAKRILPGMDVLIEPASVKREEYGLLLGRVVEIDDFPVSPAGMRQALGNEELVREFAAKGPKIEVRVELERNPATASGYQWTSTQSTLGSLLASRLPHVLAVTLPLVATAPGPPIVLTSGTPCTVDIITERQPPIRLVLPGFLQ